MDNHQSDLPGRILERISTDKAVHEAMQRFWEEIQGFRADINGLRQEVANPSPARYLTTSEVVEMFGISTETVRRRVKDGVWPAWRNGRQIRFGRDEIRPSRSGGDRWPPIGSRLAGSDGNGTSSLAPSGPTQCDHVCSLPELPSRSKGSGAAN
ncbi:helix-turn-helix domain-containing protein [Arthrobacter sp. D1-29]